MSAVGASFAMRRAPVKTRARRGAASGGTTTARARAGRPSTSATAATAGGDADARATLAVFVSGGGSNMRAIDAACESGAVRGRVGVVVTNAADCGGAGGRERAAYRC